MRFPENLRFVTAVIAIGTSVALSGCAQFANQSTAAAVSPARVYLAGLDTGADAAGGRVKIVDAETGDLHSVDVPQLGGDSEYWLLPRGNRVVYWAGGDSVYSTDAEFQGQPERLGKSSPWMTFIPAARGDSVWLISSGQETVSTVEEITADGEVVVPPVRPWEGRYPQAATSAGLLFPREHGTTIWDPMTDEVVGQLPGIPFAASGDLVADCEYPADAVKVTNVLTGETHGYPLPSDLGILGCGEGEFSPDGRHLALSMFPTRSEPHAPWPVVVVDLASGESTLVPDLNVNRSRNGSGYLDLSWAPGGDALYISIGTGGLLDVDGGLYEYRPGGASVRQLDVGEPDFMRMTAD